MANMIKVCVDRTPLITTHDRGERLALMCGYMWTGIGPQIRVRFMGGDPTLRAKVEQYAKIWAQFANISLLFNNAHDAEVRVSFTLDGTSWSAIGTDCQSYDWDKPTMNFGWLTPQSSDDVISSVVLHEFGHALGCIHEHQSPDATGIQWDKPAVYAHYANLNPPWSEQKVDQNIFAVYSATQTVFTKVDKTSIMMYPIDSSFTIDRYSAGWNTTLSQTDKDFIKERYP